MYVFNPCRWVLQKAISLSNILLYACKCNLFRLKRFLELNILRKLTGAQGLNCIFCARDQVVRARVCRYVSKIIILFILKHLLKQKQKPSGAGLRVVTVSQINTAYKSPVAFWSNTTRNTFHLLSFTNENELQNSILTTNCPNPFQFSSNLNYE